MSIIKPFKLKSPEITDPGELLTIERFNLDKSGSFFLEYHLQGDESNTIITDHERTMHPHEPPGPLWKQFCRENQLALPPPCPYCKPEEQRIYFVHLPLQHSNHSLKQMEKGELSRAYWNPKLGTW